MTYTYYTGLNDIYAVMQTKDGTNYLTQLSLDLDYKITDLKSSPNLISLYPNNCGNKVKVTQKLVVVSCSLNGEVLVLLR